MELEHDPAFCKIEEALEELRAGRMIVLVDDEHRENEGDLVIAAENVTPQSINFMIRHACGRLCLAMSKELCQRVGLDLLPGVNLDPSATPFTHNFDARYGITTGISAFDRAQSILTAIDDKSTPADLVKDKGHMDGLMAKEGGVLVRAGHTEGSVDLARMAGFKQAAVICEIIKEDGHMARVPDLKEYCKTHNLKMCTIAELIRHRRSREKLVKREISLKLPTEFGTFDLFGYSSIVDPETHLALTVGNVGTEIDGTVTEQTEPILVRVHSECLTGDVLHSALCDCGSQLHFAMQQIVKAGKGVLLYMRQEGRGIGLLNKMKAYKLQQEEGLDTVEANQRLGFPADLRHYGIGAQILYDLGVRQIRLLTNNPKKIIGLDSYGLKIIERVKIELPPNINNRKYLNTKKTKLGHLLEEV
ncbi:GTP cyclohydrolase II [Telmatocola sphagniphila]|uniref:GTP cyclohydrolase-2 n=2 Tax=Telmatocola sphagniphila TaxID=1123043 RepID=A0A8E6EVF9_9BACT|nr:GTP cyclohydrolase II [Telmatocola sphagniphila]